MISKTIKTVLFASLITAMILPFSGMNFAEAKQTDEEKVLEKVTKYENKFQKQLAKADLDKINEKVMKDDDLSRDLAGKSVTLDGYSYTFNVYELDANPEKPVDIILHYTVDDKSLTVIVDGTNNKIIDYEFTDIGGPLIPNNGLIVSQYSGSAIKGIRMDYNGPNFTWNGIGWTAMLVNGGMVGATSANACDPTKASTSYWAQGGVLMNSYGRQLVYADTTTSCIPKVLSTSQTNPAIGASLVTQITVDSANSIWYVTTSNASTGQVYSHQQYVAGTTSIQTGTPLTSVFFENPRPAGENWGTYAANPKINKAYGQSTTNGVWNYWGGQTDYVTGCSPGGYNWSGYASGTLSGVGVTYNVSMIRTYCGVS